LLFGKYPQKYSLAGINRGGAKPTNLAGSVQAGTKNSAEGSAKARKIGSAEVKEQVYVRQCCGPESLEDKKHT
jgi:hypothetical protein